MSFKQFFCDDTGALSMMRLVLFIGVVGTFFVWALVCLLTTAFHDPTPLTGPWGVALGAKTIQSFSENKP